MKKAFLVSLCLYSLPLLAFAQAKIQDYLIAFVGFLSGFIIPLFIALAALFLLWGLAKYFIFSGASSEGREQGKSLALWGFIGLIFLFSIWGLVNILISSLNIAGTTPLKPDYLK